MWPEDRELWGWVKLHKVIDKLQNCMLHTNLGLRLPHTVLGLFNLPIIHMHVGLLVYDAVLQGGDTPIDAVVRAATGVKKS